MATTNVTTSLEPEQLPSAVDAANEDRQTPFERLVARMKGTGRIVRDIVSPDPEPWNCEIE